jgi:hypothetical protein
MFCSALASYFIFSSELVGAHFATTRSGRDVVGALAAVLATNFCIAAYVYMAFNEPDEPARAADEGADDGAGGAEDGAPAMTREAGDAGDDARTARARRRARAHGAD